METLKKDDVLLNIKAVANQLNAMKVISLIAKDDVLTMINNLHEQVESLKAQEQEQKQVATKFEFTQELKEIIQEAIEEAISDIDICDSDIEDYNIASLETNEYGNEVRVEICYDSSNLNDVVQSKMSVSKIVSTIEENMNAYLEEEKNNAENEENNVENA
jgi:hypothetical protein